EDVDLVVAGRNLKLKVAGGELWVERNYAYTGLWLGVRLGSVRVKKVLEELRWSIVMLSLLAEVFREEEIHVFQGRESRAKWLCDFESIARMLGDTPVLVIKSSEKLGRDFIEYLSATQPVLPIYAVEGRMGMRRGELLGALYLL
ncbi:MAG: hypothetical protein DRJ67_12370, partial [Thermoprotei archaeon]